MVICVLSVGWSSTEWVRMASSSSSVTFQSRPSRSRRRRRRLFCRNHPMVNRRPMTAGTPVWSRCCRRVRRRARGPMAAIDPLLPSRRTSNPGNRAANRHETIIRRIWRSAETLLKATGLLGKESWRETGRGRASWRKRLTRKLQTLENRLRLNSAWMNFSCHRSWFNIWIMFMRRSVRTSDVCSLLFRWRLRRSWGRLPCLRRRRLLSRKPKPPAPPSSSPSTILERFHHCPADLVHTNTHSVAGGRKRRLQCHWHRSSSNILGDWFRHSPVDLLLLI